MQVTKITIDGKEFDVIKSDKETECDECFFLDGKCPVNHTNRFLCSAIAQQRNAKLFFTESK